MSDKPRIGMSLELASDDDRRWHQDVGFVGALVAGLDEHDLWLAFDIMSLDYETEPLDRKRLTKAASTWKSGHLELFQGDPARAYVGIDAGGILAKLRFRTPPLDDGATIVDGLIAWARQAAALAGDRARVSSGSIYPLDISYPARRPPLEHDFIRFGTLVDFYGVSWSKDEIPDAVEALVRGKLPTGASRTIDGDLVILRWITGDPADPREQARACIRQEDWWARHASARPKSGWNDLGDQAVVPWELEPRAPFTLFDAEEGVGYRAVVVLPDGKLDGVTWPEVAQLTALRRLGDGTPMNKIRLIVPVRENALAIAEQARSLGVDAVVYKDDC